MSFVHVHNQPNEAYETVLVHSNEIRCVQLQERIKCELLKVSNTTIRLAISRPTLAVAPQNGTKSDLRRSEIKKFS